MRNGADDFETGVGVAERQMPKAQTLKPTSFEPLVEYPAVARIYFERRDMGDEARRLLDTLDRGGAPQAATECTPPIDVIETQTTLEVVMDIPGVAADDIQVAFARNMLVIAGRKSPSRCDHRDAAFHLAERAFGSFTRAVRMTAAYDAGAATATLSAGELRIVLPRITERRGTEIRIPVRVD